MIHANDDIDMAEGDCTYVIKEGGISDADGK